MNIKTKVSILVLSFVIAVASIFFIVKHFYSKSDIIRIAIMPSSCYGEGESSDVYYFTVNKRNILEVSEIWSKGENISSSKFVNKTLETYKRELSKAEITSIIELANKLFSSDYTPQNHKTYDSWTVIISYEGKNIVDDYYEPHDYYRPVEFQELTNLLISLSPTPVSLHGFA